MVEGGLDVAGVESSTATVDLLCESVGFNE